MIITKAVVHPYSLDLTHPWMTADGHRVSQRKGLLVTLHSDQGTLGTGDCAPLQSMGSESLDSAERAITELSSQFAGESTDQLLKNLNKVSRVPATKFALESALMDLQAKAQETPIFKLLGGSEHYIKVNGNAGNIQSNSTKTVQQLIESGFSVIKIKVGFQSVPREVALLRQLCEELPSNIRLRLDANRAWNDSDALRFVDGVSELPIETLEEPLESNNLKVMTLLQERAPFNLALDESLFPFLRLYPFNAIPAERIIIKPTIRGGIQASLVLIRHAKAANIRTTVTSTLESACGIYCTAHVAALSDHINEPNAHGLATSSWFQNNVGEPPIVNNGQIDISRYIGSGYALPSELDR